MTNMNREYFARKLFSICNCFDDPNFDIVHYNKKIMSAFLACGSETPDNLHCFETVEYSKAIYPDSPYRTLFGFKLKTKVIFLQQILGVLEAVPIPRELSQVYSDLENKEWIASMLMSKKIVQAFSPQHSESRELLSNIPMEQFAQRLCSLYDHFDEPDFNVNNYNVKVMKAFMEFDWIYSGNQNCFENIEYSRHTLSDLSGSRFGFKIIDKPIFIVDILNHIETEPVPEKVQEIFPELVDEEWQALLRMATMIVSAFSPIS